MPGRPPRRGAASSRGRGSATGRRGRSRGRSDAGSASLAENEEAAAAETSELADDGDESAQTAAASMTATASSARGTAAGTPNDASRALASQPEPLPANDSRANMGTATTTLSQGLASGLSSKLRPKAIRRGEAERERIDAAEMEKLNQRLAKDAKLKARANRFRGRRARGGSPFMAGRGGYPERPAGIFSEPPATIGAPGRTSTGSNKAAGSSSQGGVSSAITGRPSTTNGYSSATSYRDEKSRVNTDLLNSFTQEYYEEMANDGIDTSKGRRKKKIMPMGLLREPRKDPDVLVATNEAMAADATPVDGEELEEDEDSDLYVDDPDKLHRDDVNLVDDNEVWEHVAPKKRGKVKIKQEDGATAAAMDVEDIAAHQQPRSSSSSAPKKKSPRKETTKRRNPSPKDSEEAAIAADLRKMLHGLGRLHTGSSGEQETPLDNKLFLFQFPPVLPPLKSKTAGGSGDLIKDESDDDVVMLDRPQKATIDLATGEETTEITKEDGRAGAKPDNKHTALRDLIGDGGFVGQLNVRKSGKVELSWGGRTLEMVPGDDVMSLMTAVILEEADQKTKEPGDMDGTAYGMGRVEGKFVFTPVWGDEEDWEVPEEDLVVE